jgi:hypothetical protein
MTTMSLPHLGQGVVDSIKRITGNPALTSGKNGEVFLYEPAAVPQLRQLTVTTKGSQSDPTISHEHLLRI